MNAENCIMKGMNISCCTMDGIAYILFEDKKEVIALNETGSVIWNLVGENQTVADVILAVMNVFDGDEETIKPSVMEFLDELLEMGALTISTDRERMATNA